MEDDVIASEVIRQNSRLYGAHVVSNLFPGVIDGLKRVRRRILYRQQPIDDTFPGMKLVSNTLEIHPYGDASVYATACKMIDTFRSTFPLLVMEGTGGSYGGDKPASARYTKFRLTEFCKDIFFRGVNFKTLPMEQTEDLMGREIKYFIPKIPTALLFNNESIGYGYSSRTIPLKFENICDLVVDYVSCRDKLNWNYSRLAKLFVPCFPIKIFIKNTQTIVEAYSNGNFTHPVDTEGLFVIRSNNSVMFRTLAYGISPSDIRETLTKAVCDKNHWLTKADIQFETFSDSKTPNFAEFLITAKRGSNIFEVIEGVKGLVRLRTPIYPINNFVHDNHMLPLDPPGIIKMWYKERTRSILGTKKYKQQELLLLKMKLETYLIICEHVDEVITIIKTMELEQIYSSLRARFELSVRQCEILLDADLRTLMRSKRSELEARLVKVSDELTELQDSFNKIDAEICTEVKGLKKKYKTNTEFISSEPKYIGCLLVGELGILQISNLSEVEYTGKLFSGVDLRFIPYHSGVRSVKFHKLSTVYKWVDELPMTTNMTGVIIQYRTKTHLFTRVNGKSQCVPTAVVMSASRAITNHVSSSPWVITMRGRVIRAPEELFDTRRHTANIVYAFDDIRDTKRYVVLSVNAAHPNVIRMQAIVPGKNKVLFSGAGETAVVAVVGDNTDEVIVNLPAFHKHNILFISNIIKNTVDDHPVDVNTRLMVHL